MDTVQATTDPISKVGGASVKTCLGMGRKCRRWRGRRNEGTRSEELETLHGGTVTTPEGLQPMGKCKAHPHKGPWRTNTRAYEMCKKEGKKSEKNSSKEALCIYPKPFHLPLPHRQWS